MKSAIQLNWICDFLHTRLNTLTHTAVKYGAALRLLSSAQALNYKGGDGLREREKMRPEKDGQLMQNEFKHPSNITKHKQLETNRSLTWSDVNKWMKWQWTGRTSARVTVCHLLSAAGLQTCNTAPMQTHTYMCCPLQVKQRHCRLLMTPHPTNLQENACSLSELA